jgi:MFS family permease
MGVVPIASDIASQLDPHATSSSSTSAILVTIWELGEAAGPLLIAPLSEILGRYPVIHACNTAFIAATLLAASSKSITLLIMARMLTGLSVTAGVLHPAIIGDMFEDERRGGAMSMIMLAPLLGGATGPIISGAIAQSLGWRWVILTAAALALYVGLLLLIFFRETYKMSILRRKVARMQRESGEFETNNGGHRTGGHEDLVKLWRSLTRPFAVLFGSGVLMLLSLFNGVVFSFFYTITVSLPDVLVNVYDFTPAQTGSCFISLSTTFTPHNQ